MAANSSLQRDIIVLGGGHNTLVAAFYLAKKGYKPLILERRSHHRRRRRHRRISPGFQMLHGRSRRRPALAQIVKDMQLDRHGLEKLESPVRIFAPHPDGRALQLSTPTPSAPPNDIKKFSAKDAANYIDFSANLGRIAGIAAQLMDSLRR